jgi:cysteine desulfurase/selenocysteine lyase
LDDVQNKLGDPALKPNFADGFPPFNGRVWLNCAHQGPLPIVAADALLEALRWKQAPYELTVERFNGVPERLRRALARLIGAETDEIVLGNSASHGLHLIANGLGLTSGDEVVVMSTDFPSDILPWLRLQAQGVVVRQLKPSGFVLEPDEIRPHVHSRTRVLCLTWVHSFSGWSIDLDAIGSLCRESGVIFVVNASQAIGARPVNVKAAIVDALVSVGHKWLCGPYGTGFCWVRPDLLRRLVPTKAYWLSTLTADDLARPLEVSLPQHVDHRSFDIFGTANFFNFVPWTASIEHILSLGVANIAEHDSRLVDQLVAGLDRDRFAISSPVSGPRRSTLIVFSHRDTAKNAVLYEQLTNAGVHVALRAAQLRVSPHLYNTEVDIDRALTILNQT